MKVISITNQKGGVGKTTSAINISFYLAKMGYKVLIVDFDPQGNATSGLGVDKNSLGSTMSDVISGSVALKDVILETEFHKLKLAPSTPILANTEIELANVGGRFSRLREALKTVSDEFDYVILDCPPSLSLLTVNSFIASDFLILPVQAEFYAMEGLGQLLESMKLVKKGMNPNIELLGVLPTMVDSRTTLSGQVYEEIKRFFPGKVFSTPVPRNIRLAEAPSHGVPIGVYDRFSKGARAYKSITKEIVKRIEENN
ncbi:ParA family protein [Candidatus Nanogingivalis gingivitcus]|jgi:spoOJ regulator protein|uniref:Sporulation initiation inhibitor protein Soj n=1 Tax=Candidatus Nanogingivalis gingivitcus TaxID=2171992 RepID=A0ABY0FKT3_9BACT|nr:ParA family protein [Candidatus Nanogingivalis gingivitcus]RYC72677.1 Sporulation initiation inhibitor protein Soj [Candidatus Nanogingivalis gingivitcus]